MMCRTCCIVALVACTGCKPEVDRVTGGTASSSASSASSSSGDGGTGGDLPACIARLTTPDGLPDVDAEFTMSNQVQVQIDSIDVGPSGEIAFAGSTWNGNAGQLLLNGNPIADCQGGSCEFVGVLALDGSLEWIRNYTDQVVGSMPQVVRFDSGGLVLLGSQNSLSAPFPSSNVMPPDIDPYWARFDDRGELVAFVPLGSSGAEAVIEDASPTSDGGMMIGGFFLNGWMMDFPTGSFAGCGASFPLDHPLGFLAHLGPDGACTRLEPIGSSQTMLLAMGGDSTSSGDRVTVAGAYTDSLALGTQQIQTPKGGAQSFFGSAAVLSTGEAWGQLSGTALLPEADWSDGGQVLVSRDGSTVLIEKSKGAMGSDLALRDVIGAFEAPITSPAGCAAFGVGVGRAPTSMIEDRPILASGVCAAGSTANLGGGSSIDGGSWWLALFDGTGHLCAAKASHLPGLSPLLGGSSVVFRSGSIEDAVSGARSVIRRIQLSELAE